MTTSTGRSGTTGVDPSARSGSTGTAGEGLQSAASDLADQAGRTAEIKASTAMDQFSQALEQVAGAARQAGDSLRTERPALAGVADTAADKATDLSTYLREHDAGEVVASVEATARRQPALVIAGAFALGLATARLLRSAAPSNASSSGGRYQSGSDWYAAGGPAGTARYGNQRAADSDYVSTSTGSSSAPYATGTTKREGSINGQARSAEGSTPREPSEGKGR